MLLELHVKNLALIEKADVEFGEGLNILTGETGAGKSIIIGSVTMALGGKASKDVIRRGADHAYIELIFFVDSKEKKKALMQLGTEPTEEGMVIISRKIMPSRSVSRINDETVTMARLRQITGLLLDIHGQHEHQSLLYKSKHLEILDAYVKAQTQPVKRKIEEEYKNYCKLKERLLSFKTDEDARLREMDFLRFEIQEIENGEVKEGEEEELTLKYRRFAHARRIAEELENARGLLQREFAEQAAEYDKALEGIRDQLYDAEAILNDASREISSYMGSMEFDEEVFRTTESRLDQIHDLQRKYGNTTQLMLENLEKKKALCEKAEALKDSTDWKVTADALTKLQKEWKTIGPVAKKHSDAIWKRFITACDYFFEQKNKATSSQRSVETENMEKKKALIEKLSAIDENMDTEEASNLVRDLMKEWNSIGHVPFKEKDKLYKQYHGLIDQLFDRFNINASNKKLSNFRSNISNIQGGGTQSLYREREKLVRTYENMKNELQTYENNLGFLTSTSKKGSSLLTELNRKVDKLKADLELVLQKIKVIDESIKAEE